MALTSVHDPVTGKIDAAAMEADATQRSAIEEGRLASKLERDKDEACVDEKNRITRRWPCAPHGDRRRLPKKLKSQNFSLEPNCHSGRSTGPREIRIMFVCQAAQARAEDALFEAVAAPAFPCVGAKSAMARGTLKVLACHRLDSSWDDLTIHRELLEWAAEYRADPGGLRSLAISFEGPADIDEAQFESLMWQRIQSFADKDAWLGQPYDHRVSADPSDPHFSLSFGGEAFFVVGLHPNASRQARRFPRPTLVFNIHDQFERLRSEGRYDKMRERILHRDKALAGDINPMLARHGEASEAAQYSGRMVDEEWRCPFRDKRGPV